MDGQLEDGQTEERMDDWQMEWMEKQVADGWMNGRIDDEWSKV